MIRSGRRHRCIVQSAIAPAPAADAAAVASPRPLQRRDSLLIFPVAAPVDLVDLLDPTPPIGMLEAQHVLERPVEVVGDIGYLLMELNEGVACYSPTSLTSTSTSVPQFGQVTRAIVLPSLLMRR